MAETISINIKVTDFIRRFVKNRFFALHYTPDRREIWNDDKKLSLLGSIENEQSIGYFLFARMQWDNIKIIDGTQRLMLLFECFLSPEQRKAITLHTSEYAYPNQTVIYDLEKRTLGFTNFNRKVSKFKVPIYKLLNEEGFSEIKIMLRESNKDPRKVEHYIETCDNLFSLFNNLKLQCDIVNNWHYNELEEIAKQHQLK